MRIRISLLLVAALLAPVLALTPARGQVPPHRFYGKVVVDGKAVPDGSTVSAWVETKKKGEARTVASGYWLDVVQESGEALEGKVVSFKLTIEGKLIEAWQTAGWEMGGVSRVDLTGSLLETERPAQPILLYPQLPAASARRGQSFPVRIMLSPRLNKIWKAEVTVSYDSRQFKVQRVEKGEIWALEPSLDVTRLQPDRLTYIVFRTKLPPSPLPEGELFRVVFGTRNDSPSKEGKIALVAASFVDETARAAPLEMKSPSISVSIVGLRGDINGDDRVDFRDSALLSASYGARQGDPAFDPRCDLNEDEEVGLEDLAILAAQMGRR